jgi:hypothetical protein
MDTNVLPRRLNRLELWWWELPELVRWMAGCISVAAVVGIAGGMLA